MSTAIVVYSKHHGNTRKLVYAIKNANDGIKIVDITENRVVDLNAYDVIGIASGIYMGKFNYDLMEYLKEKLPGGKKVFALFTCGNMSEKYTKEVKVLAELRSCKWLGEYGCKGFDTFGPFKLVGGIQKGHPTEEEIQGAVDFYSHLMI